MSRELLAPVVHRQAQGTSEAIFKTFRSSGGLQGSSACTRDHMEGKEEQASRQTWTREVRGRVRDVTFGWRLTDRCLLALVISRVSA